MALETSLSAALASCCKRLPKVGFSLAELCAEVGSLVG